MPIKVVITAIAIDVSQAEDGELLAVTLDTGQKLFLQVRIAENRAYYFTFDGRWLPPDLVTQCTEIAEKLASLDTFQEAYEEREDRSQDLQSFLVEKLWKDARVCELDAGYQPDACLDRAFGWRIRHITPPLNWEWCADGVVDYIEPITEREIENYLMAPAST